MSNKITNKTKFIFTDDIQRGNSIDDLPAVSLKIGKNFSRKAQDTSMDLLDNPNIIDKLNFVSPSNLEIQDKFDSLDDPIYDLDEPRSNVYKEADQKILKNINIKLKSNPGARYK